MRSVYAFLFFLSCLGSLSAQVVVYEDYVPEKQRIYTKESMGFAFIHTAGLGLGYTRGHYSPSFRYSAWEINASTMWNPKNFKTEPFGSYYGKARRYVMGQINSFAVIRGGYGSRWTFAEKPFWGGVNISLDYSGGFSLGLAFPQYLYIIYNMEDPNTGEASIRTELEKFDPKNQKHRSWDQIYGRGPVFHGVWHLRPYPGIYAKVGLTFEFGKLEEKIRALQAGLLVDYYFIGVPLMAENPYRPIFLNFYISFSFGKRFGIR
ncbi:MAG: hypothetical protein RSC04_05515 [Bacteroidales bacterium]